MVQFDDTKQKQHLEQLREQEEEALVGILSKKYAVPYIDLTTTPVNTDALNLIPEKDARDAQIALFTKIGKKIEAAVRSPAHPKTLAALADLKDRGYTPIVYITSTKSLAFAWERYRDIQFASESTRGLLDIGSKEISDFLKKVNTLEDGKRFIKETLAMKKAYRVSRIVEVFLASALALSSSDVHIEPSEASVRLRFRLNGILTDIITFDRETYRLLISRIKLLSGLKLNIQKEAQDGRFSIRLDESDVEIRTSVLPGEFGEAVVLRILDPKATRGTIERLALEKSLRAAILKQIVRPNGLILTTGPTGSGKTTTLYAFLRHVHTPEVKIITIEDPIEYHLPGIVQTQVDDTKHYTFAEGLRAALRQDPDIIMVGEIRDKETAEVAIHAALTGHLVISTLHTNNAAGAFPRLIDLGINSKIISSAITMALAQRLIRTLCEECKKEVPLAGNEKKIIETILATVYDKGKLVDVQKKSLWKAVGCTACDQSGYADRCGVFEGILMDDAVDAAVRGNPSEREIEAAARPQGFLTMRQDGIVKVLQGITTLEEIARVVDLGV